MHDSELLDVFPSLKEVLFPIVPKLVEVEIAAAAQCGECRGKGTTYTNDPCAGPDEDPGTEAIDCEACGGTGLACEVCGGQVRYLSVDSREPHGERFHDEGWKCTRCGVVQMREVEPPCPVSSGGLMWDLMRSIMLAKGLQEPAAIRMGKMLARSHREVA